MSTLIKVPERRYLLRFRALRDHINRGALDADMALAIFCVRPPQAGGAHWAVGDPENLPVYFRDNMFDGWYPVPLLHPATSAA